MAPSVLSQAAGTNSKFIMRAIITFASVFTVFLAAGATGLVWAQDTGAGIIVSHQPSPHVEYHNGVETCFSGRRIYIADPAITKLPGGTLLIAHSYFGADSTELTSGITKIFSSSDNGASWGLISTLTDTLRSSFFSVGGTLYLQAFKTTQAGASPVTAHTIIRKSTDKGRTWTTPGGEMSGLVYTAGNQGGAPVTPVICNDRIWLVIGQLRTLSAPVTADLLRADSWIRSPGISSSAPAIDAWPAEIKQAYRLWGEAQIVGSPEHGVTLLPRIQFTAPDTAPHTALVTANIAGTALIFNPSGGFAPLPGADKKFGAVYDPGSGRYYAITNTVLPAFHDYIDPLYSTRRHDLIRNTAALLSSADLRHWDVEKILIHSDNVAHDAWQYFNFVIDGGTLHIASRTALQTAADTHPPPRGHDSNLLTYHRLENFRSAAPQHFLRIEAGTVNRYETTHYKDAPLGEFAAGHAFAGAPDALAQADDGTVFVRESGGSIIKSFDAHGNYLGAVPSLPAGVILTTSGTQTLAIAQPSAGSRSWTGAVGNDWYDPRNWYYWNRPDTDAETAIFGAAGASASTITLTQSHTLAALVFRSPHSHTIAQGSIKSADDTATCDTGALTLKAAAGPAALAVQQGRHTLAVPLALSAATDITLAEGTALAIEHAVTFSDVLNLHADFSDVAAGAPAPLIIKTLTKSGTASIKVTLAGVTTATPAGTKVITLTNGHNLAAADFTATADVPVTHTFANNTLSISQVPPPVITGFPDTMACGQPVTITGTNFTGVTAVLFNGVEATAFTVNSSTQITATVPLSLTSGGKIAIRCTDGRAAVSGNSFILALAASAPIAPRDAVMTAGQTGAGITLEASAQGSPAPAYQWQVLKTGGTWQTLADDTRHNGATASTLTITHAAFSMNGWQYRYIASNGYGSAVTSAPATLTVAPDVFPQPGGLVLDASGNLYITDAQNHTLQKITPDHTQVIPLAGLAGASGTLDGASVHARFASPGGIKIHPLDGRLLLVDTGNNALRAVTATGSVATLLSHLNQPTAIAIDNQGNAYVADTGNHTIRKITADGRSGIIADATAGLNHPAGIAVDADGWLYVADTGNHTIRVINPATLEMTLLAGAPQTAGSADGHPTGVARFRSPRGLVVDGLLYSGSRDGSLYLADAGNHIIREITRNTVRTLAGYSGDDAGPAIAGIPGFQDGTDTNAWFNSPNDIALAANGDLYIADTGNASIRKLTFTHDNAHVITLTPIPEGHQDDNPPNGGSGGATAGNGGGGVPSIYFFGVLFSLLTMRFRLTRFR
jgi:sugar lactone lactonase YvrE